jgi:hypothetical protein
MKPAPVQPAPVQPAPVQEPVAFLANGTRFKISYDSRQSGGQIHGIPPELGGRWVAFVAAEDDCHLKLTTPPAQPAPTVQEPIYQTQMMNGKWIDQAKKSYEYNKAHGHTVRIVYTTPPAAPVPLTDEDRAILEAVKREMDDDGNAPGHRHKITGVWDDDNGELAGKPCAWCMTWKKFTTLIERETAHGITEKGQP